MFKDIPLLSVLSAHFISALCQLLKKVTPDLLFSLLFVCLLLFKGALVCFLLHQSKWAGVVRGAEEENYPFRAGKQIGKVRWPRAPLKPADSFIASQIKILYITHNT